MSDAGESLWFLALVVKNKNKNYRMTNVVRQMKVIFNEKNIFDGQSGKGR